MGRGCSDGLGRHGYTDGKGGHSFSDGLGDMALMMGRETWLYK